MVLAADVDLDGVGRDGEGEATDGAEHKAESRSWVLRARSPTVRIPALGRRKAPEPADGRLAAASGFLWGADVAPLMIVEARTPEQVAQVRALFVAYGESLGFSLCFQDFDAELAGLPKPYVAPRGTLLLAVEDGQPAGCVGLRGLEPGVAEMKRLFVKPEFRGRGLGLQLAQRVLAEARARGHARVRLDTVPAMKKAQAMYEWLGFVGIPAYTENPVPGARFMELRF